MLTIYSIRWPAIVASLACAIFAFQGAFETPPIAPSTPTGQTVPLSIFADYRTMATLAGFFFAVFAFFHNAVDRLNQARKQHTLSILFETRLSQEFRRHLEHRKRFFPEGTKVDAALFWAYVNPDPGPATQDPTAESFLQRECAEAIRSLLNYYEFLALGIARGDLDEDMLKGTVRGIMVRLVRDMYDVIESHRTPNDHNPRTNANTYKQLIRLYSRWKSDGDPEFPNVRQERVLAGLRRKIAHRVDPF